MGECAQALVDQYAIDTAKDWVIGIHSHVCQATTIIEGRIVDVGDAVGNRDTLQTGAASERSVPDAGDRTTIGRTGNVQARRTPSVTRNRDRTVVRCECELRLY
jgi:hypothetical protein